MSDLANSESRKPSGGSDRSQATRRALLDSANRLFGRFGFDATSNRALADDAKVNQALIGYHFGNKDGLYRAVFEDLASRIMIHMAPLIMEIESDLKQLLSTGNAISDAARRKRSTDMTARILTHYVRVITAAEFEDSATLIVREQLAPSAAFEILWEKQIGQFIATTTQLVALSRGHKKPTDKDRLIVITLMGQVLVFRLARATVSRHMGWAESYSDKNLQDIQDLIRDNIIKMLA